MCGRYGLYRPTDVLAKVFGAREAQGLRERYAPSYNIAPTADVVGLAAGEQGERILDLYRWGLAGRLFNARAESLAASHAFGGAMRRRRLALLAAGGFLAAAFVNPASQLQNTFLADERGFSGARITLFTLLTGTPASIGVIVGGRLAERSRRLVCATGLIVGTTLVVLAYLAVGWPLWALGIVAGIFSAATVPALAVYGPELFPTAVRGRANGVISVVSRIGAVTGLLAAGLLSSRLGGLGPALAVLGAGPLLLAVLVLAAYPETASRELEDLNPEDRTAPLPT